MSDTERVVEIIRVMGMNNIQFSQKTGISPASLSHITSGRSNPTLTILRNIVESFPELNPEWVLLGRGDMIRILVQIVWMMPLFPPQEAV